MFVSKYKINFIFVFNKCLIYSIFKIKLTDLMGIKLNTWLIKSKAFNYIYERDIKILLIQFN